MKVERFELAVKTILQRVVWKWAARKEEKETRTIGKWVWRRSHGSHFRRIPVLLVTRGGSGKPPQPPPAQSVFDHTSEPELLSEALSGILNRN